MTTTAQECFDKAADALNDKETDLSASWRQLGEAITEATSKNGSPSKPS